MRVTQLEANKIMADILNNHNYGGGDDCRLLDKDKMLLVAEVGIEDKPIILSNQYIKAVYNSLNNHFDHSVKILVAPVRSHGDVKFYSPKGDIDPTIIDRLIDITKEVEEYVRNEEKDDSAGGSAS